MNTRNLKKYALGLAMASIVSFSLVPALALAQTADGGIGSNDEKSANFQLIPCDGSAAHPCDFNMLIILANRLIKFLLYLAIPLVTGMILYTGWLYLTANGETVQLAKAKKMFVPVILGMFWIGASYIVIYTIIDKFVDPKFANSAKGAIKILDTNQK